MDGEEVSITRRGDEVVVNVPGTSSAGDAKPLSQLGQKKPPIESNIKQVAKTKR